MPMVSQEQTDGWFLYTRCVCLRRERLRGKYMVRAGKAALQKVRASPMLRKSLGWKSKFTLSTHSLRRCTFSHSDHNYTLQPSRWRRRKPEAAEAEEGLLQGRRPHHAWQNTTSLCKTSNNLVQARFPTETKLIPRPNSKLTL
jgi:hypothetical protein